MVAVGSSSSVAIPAHPAAVFVPEHYEPNYPYPLIIWFHGRGGSEQELADVMPRISTRNYLGLALRGAADDGSADSRCWPAAADACRSFEEQLHATVRRLRQEWHMHSERVYLAGFDDGGAMALRLLLSRPEWFAGAAAVCGRFPAAGKSLLGCRAEDPKRVLLVAASPDKSTDARRNERTLRGIGWEVDVPIVESSGELTDEMLSHLNRWMMRGVCCAT